ncbi:hypothetical protein F5Y10DRAFT_267579 [Nemania abortiva]|nr:hypothetical protein F5Y10DRAFT_267579 [Nemania abortiva]
MPPSRDVQSLYDIADKRNSRHPLKETIDAKSLLKLIKKEALAFRRPDSSRLVKLVNCFHQCQALAARYSKEPGDDSEDSDDSDDSEEDSEDSQDESDDSDDSDAEPLQELKDSILDFLMILDECFFFKTLTRKVKTKHGRRHLVSLKIKDTRDTKYDSHNRKGTWEPHERSVTLWLKGQYEGEDGEESIFRFPIEEVLHTCLHESIHAFIWLFENEDHPKHDERIGKDANGNGHAVLIHTDPTLMKKVITLVLHTLLWEFRDTGALAFLWAVFIPALSHPAPFRPAPFRPAASPLVGWLVGWLVGKFNAGGGACDPQASRGAFSV